MKMVGGCSGASSPVAVLFQEDILIDNLAYFYHVIGHLVWHCDSIWASAKFRENPKNYARIKSRRQQISRQFKLDLTITFQRWNFFFQLHPADILAARTVSKMFTPPNPTSSDSSGLGLTPNPAAQRRRGPAPRSSLSNTFSLGPSVDQSGDAL